MKRNLEEETEASPTLFTDSEESDPPHAFLAWLRLHEFNLCPNVSLARYNDSRGYAYIATKDIRADTLLFRVKKDILLNTKTSAVKVLLKNKSFKQLSDWDQLALAMLSELNIPDSRWRPYFNMLPETLDSTFFWTDDEMLALSGTSIEESSKSMRKVLKETFDEDITPILKAHPNLFGKVTFNDFRRCVGIIMAYSFSDDDEYVSLVPSADTLNHRTGSNNARLYFSKKGFEMRSLNLVKEGTELYNTYGDLSNAQLLEKYGFVDIPGENSFTFLEFSVQEIYKCFSKRCKQFEERLKLLQNGGVIDDDETFAVGMNFECSQEFKFVFQAFHAEENHFKDWIGRVELDELGAEENADGDAVADLGLEDAENEDEKAGSDEQSEADQDGKCMDEDCHDCDGHDEDDEDDSEDNFPSIEMSEDATKAAIASFIDMVEKKIKDLSRSRKVNGNEERLRMAAQVKEEEKALAEELLQALKDGKVSLDA